MLISEHRLTATAGLVILLVVGLTVGLRFAGLVAAQPVPPWAGSPMAGATVSDPTTVGSILPDEDAGAYLGPTVTAPAAAEAVAPAGDVITQRGVLISVDSARGGGSATFTLDTPNYGELSFTVERDGTDFYFVADRDEFLLYTGDALGLAQQVAAARGGASIGYTGVPGRPEHTVVVLFESGYDAAALPGATPSYVENGGDVTVAPTGLRSTTGRLVALAIQDSVAQLTLNSRGATPNEFTFGLAAVDFQVLHGSAPDFVYAPVDQTAARADLLVAAQERRLNVTIATAGPPGMEVLAVLVQDVGS